jgi:WD40 repeat protein
LRQISQQRPLIWALLIVFVVAWVRAVTTPPIKIPDELLVLLNPTIQEIFQPTTLFVMLGLGLSLAAFFAVVSLIHWLARRLGGKGSYLGLLCALSFATLPGILIAPLRGIPTLSLPFAIWALALSVIAVRVSHTLSTKRALVAWSGGAVSIVIIALGLGFGLGSELKALTSCPPELPKISVCILPAALLDPVALAFSPDGKIIAIQVGLVPGEIVLADINTGKLMHPYERTVLEPGVVGRSTMDSAQFDDRASVSQAFSPDSKLYATTGKTVQVWDEATRKVVRELPKSVKLWDVATSELVRALPEAGTSVAFSPKGRYLTSSNQADRIKLWEVDTGSLVRTFSSEVGIAQSSSFRALTFSPDGQMLAAVTSEDAWLCEDPVVQVWEVATGRKMWELATGSTVVALNPVKKIDALECWLQLSPDGGQLALSWLGSGDEADWTEVWDLATGKEIRTDPNVEVYSPDWKLLAVPVCLSKTSYGCDNGAIQLKNVETGVIVRTLPVPHTEHFPSAPGLAFSPDGKLLATTASPEVHELLGDVLFPGILLFYVGDLTGR